MKRFLIPFFLLFSLHTFSQNLFGLNSRRIFKLSPKIKTTDYLPNIIIVKYKKSVNVSKRSINSISNSPGLTLKSAKIISITSDLILIPYRN